MRGQGDGLFSADVKHSWERHRVFKLTIKKCPPRGSEGGIDGDFLSGFGDAVRGADVDAVAAVFTFGGVDHVGVAIGGNGPLGAFTFASTALDAIILRDNVSHG